MSSKMVSYERFFRIMFGSGKLALVFAASVLFFRHMNFLPPSIDDLVILDIHVVDILFFYLFINCVAMVPLIYIERQSKIRKGVNCPECGKELFYSGYECHDCGVINFKKLVR